MLRDLFAGFGAEPARRFALDALLFRNGRKLLAQTIATWIQLRVATNVGEESILVDLLDRLLHPLRPANPTALAADLAQRVLPFLASAVDAAADAHRAWAGLERLRFSVASWTARDGSARTPGVTHHQRMSAAYTLEALEFASRTASVARVGHDAFVPITRRDAAVHHLDVLAAELKQLGYGFEVPPPEHMAARLGMKGVLVQTWFNLAGNLCALVLAGDGSLRTIVLPPSAGTCTLDANSDDLASIPHELSPDGLLGCRAVGKASVGKLLHC